MLVGTMAVLLSTLLADPQRTEADLAVLDPDVRTDVVPGALVVVSFEIANLGTRDADESVACVRGFQGEAGFTLDRGRVPPLAPGETATVGLTPRWLLPDAGPARIEIVADCDGVIYEKNNGNNIASVDVTVLAPLAFETRRLPDAVVLRPYAGTLRAVGGAPPYTFEIDGLPGGLALDGGRLTGTTSAAGSHELTVRARDASGASVEARVDLVVREDAAKDPALSVSPSILSESWVGRERCTPAASRLGALGGVPPYTFSFQSDVPPGLHALDDGQVCGVPTRAGSYSFVVSVIDGDGRISAPRAISLVIGLEPIPEQGPTERATLPTEDGGCQTAGPSPAFALLLLAIRRARGSARRSGPSDPPRG